MNDSKQNDPGIRIMTPEDVASIKWKREGSTNWIKKSRLVTIPHDLIREVLINIKAIQSIIEKSNPPLMYILDEHRMCPVQNTSFYAALEVNLMDLKTILQDFTKTGDTP